MDSSILEEARDDWAAEKFRKAAEQIDGTVRALNQDDPAIPYLNYLSVWSQRMHDQARGTWIDLLGQPDLSGWRVREGQWSADEQGRLTGVSVRYGSKLECRFDVGYRCEIMGTVAFPQNTATRTYSAGVLLVYRVTNFLHNHRSVLLVRSGGEVETAQNYKLRKHFSIPIEPSNRFHIQMWDEYLRLSVNGMLVFEGLKMDIDLPYKVYPFAIGGRAEEAGLVIRYDELKVRPLKQKPVWAVDRETTSGNEMEPPSEN